MLPGYKVIKYAEIPNFDQTKYFITQKAPTEKDDHIYIGIEMNELPEDDEVDNFEVDVF